MTNYESIDPKDIKKIFAEYFSINKITHEACICCDTVCRDCLFYGIGCNRRKKKWLDQPAFDPEKDIDWSKVPVDTPVIVWNTDEEYRRYFSGIKDGRFSVYADGRTSWSSTTGNICSWNHCKLYRPEDVEKYRKKDTENGRK